MYKRVDGLRFQILRNLGQQAAFGEQRVVTGSDLIREVKQCVQGFYSIIGGYSLVGIDRLAPGVCILRHGAIPQGRRIECVAHVVRLWVQKQGTNVVRDDASLRNHVSHIASQLIDKGVK